MAILRRNQSQKAQVGHEGTNKGVSCWTSQWLGTKIARVASNHISPNNFELKEEGKPAITNIAALNSSSSKEILFIYWPAIWLVGWKLTANPKHCIHLRACYLIGRLEADNRRPLPLLGGLSIHRSSSTRFTYQTPEISLWRSLHSNHASFSFSCRKKPEALSRWKFGGATLLRLKQKSNQIQISRLFCVMSIWPRPFLGLRYVKSPTSLIHRIFRVLRLSSEKGQISVYYMTGCVFPRHTVFCWHAESILVFTPIYRRPALSFFRYLRSVCAVYVKYRTKDPPK